METMSAETVLVEILGSHGRVQARERVTLTSETRSFTIGRSVQADFALDDPYAAAVHVSVEISPDGRLMVSDHDSINGIIVSGKRIHRAQKLELTDGVLQIGHTRLRVRTEYELLAPEKLDQIVPASLIRTPAFIVAFGGLICLLQLVYSGWLGAPRDLVTTLVTSLISAMLAAGVWIAFWALLSRVLQGEWRWLRHAAILLGIAAVFVSLDGLLELGWFMFSLPQWSTRAALVGAIAFGFALYLHLTHASSISKRRAALVACIVPALSGGAGHWVQERFQVRDVNHISASLRVYPPSLRLSSASSIDSYFLAAAALRAAADKKRKSIPSDDESADNEDDDG
jgi:hypothetical protein